MSSFFHSRQSSEILPERLGLRRNKSKRAALAERTQSQINQESGEQPTIRLVDVDSASSDVYDKTPFPSLPAQVLQPPKLTKHGYTIDDEAALSRHNSRSSSRSPNRASKLIPQALRLKQNRMSTATTASNTSNTDTLLADSLFSPASNRWSQDGTLRNTPTPHRMEERGLEAERERGEILEPVEEQSPDFSSTIRPVTSSTDSCSTERAPNSRDSDESMILVHPALRPLDSRNRLSSIESADLPISVGPAGNDVEVGEPSSEYSKYHSSSSSPSFEGSSSYNVIRYGSSSDTASVQYPQIRPATAHSPSAESAFSSTGSESVAPLSIPRKRSHTHSASAGPIFPRNRPLSTIASGSEPSSRMHIRSQLSQGSVDMLRSGPISSTRRRRTVSSDSSDGNYEIYPSDSEEVLRQIQKVSTNSQNDRRPQRTVSNVSQTGTTSFSIMRAESAVPIPLFSSNPASPMHQLPADTPSKETDGEHDDTIAELQAHPLRTKWSGHLARRRSVPDNRPPTSRSNFTIGEGDRTSQGSSIFPQWARQFYRGRVYLNSANASKVSLAGSESQTFPRQASPIRMMPWMHHRRFESGWESYNTADQSVLSERPSTARGRWHTPGNSSHFLPSIFRPATRMRANTDVTTTASATLSEEYYYYETTSGSTTSQTDSMEITPAPLRHGSPNSQLNSSTSLPAKGKSKQKKRRNWSDVLDATMTRNMTSNSTIRSPRSVLTNPQSYQTPPHLQPSRRLSNRISTWRAPSFDEALSTLISSRQNRQITLFCIGFICPISWIVAAFLPIPPRPIDKRLPEFAEEDGMTAEGLQGEKSREVSGGVRMETFDWELEKKFLKARWWRNLNRIMSFVGVVVVAIIVSFLSSSCCCDMSKKSQIAILLILIVYRLPSQSLHRRGEWPIFVSHFPTRQILTTCPH